MDPHAPPESESELQPESESATPSNSTNDLNLPADLLAEIDIVLQNTPAPPINPIDTPPGRRADLLRYTQWTVRVPPWRELMLLTPLREPVNNRIINIQDSRTLKTFLDQRIRKRNAMLAQAVGVKANPPCMQCAQGQGQFVGCIHIPVFFDGACANCVWEKSPSQRGQCSFLVEKQRQKDAAEYEKNMQHGIGQTFTSVWKLPKK
ncbi:hypothetical protein PEBR_16930 [Penicillium brasilianum]|uniref:Uncharacterized protein n=1 Tax=Penicillium brasilianum TaxID=104259 RepID=A0A1S9RV16_PENBI|nr:hypothetical protein PEBR_16930 [Penicillium brasilianum]